MRSVRIGRRGAEHLQQAAQLRGELMIWTLYERPRDFPDLFIARPSIPGKDGSVLHLTCHLQATTLAHLRAMLPAGLVQLARAPSDEPQIVECWL